MQEASSANGLQPAGSYVQRTYHPLSMLTNDTSGWCIGRPGQTQQINSHAQYGGTTITRTTDRTWDVSQCRVTQEIVESGNATRQITTDVGYDTFGNVNALTITGRKPDGTAMTPRVSGANWGANGRFLRSTTNPLSQQTSYGWDEAIGALTSVTDPNQLQTGWIYDNFGRVTRENRPDGTATTTSYDDCASDGCIDSNNKLLVKQSDLDTGGAMIDGTWTYLDRYNRPLATRSTLVSGALARIERRYDALGRVAQESAPCAWAGCAYFWTSYSYDAANRITQVSRPATETNPGPVDVRIHFEGLTARRVDTQNKETTDIANVIGVALRTTDHDGYYVQFDYDAFGNAVRMMDGALGTLQTATFDQSGFRTQSGILGAGTRTYTYNSLGELVSQSDSKSQTTTFGYDPLGRPTSRDDAQGSTSLVWGASAAAKNIGQLASKTGPTGVSESYEYDAFGRPSQTTVALGADGSSLINYSYNALGTLDALTYPTSTLSYRLKLKYEYAYGQLVRIRDFNAPTTVFWSADAMNPRGQITQESLGNGLVTTRGFDAVTGYPKFIRTGPAGGSATQNLSYLWDAMGNLIQRQDGNQGVTENFYYDNLYRIDYSQLDSTTNLDVGYTARGNMTSKLDASDSAAEAGDATRIAASRATSISTTWTSFT